MILYAVKLTINIYYHRPQGADWPWLLNIHEHVCSGMAVPQTQQKASREGTTWRHFTASQVHNRSLERAQQLAALAALIKDLWRVWVPTPPHHGSQLSVSLVPRNLMPPYGLCGYCMYLIHIYSGKLYIHKIKINHFISTKKTNVGEWVKPQKENHSDAKDKCVLKTMERGGGWIVGERDTHRLLGKFYAEKQYLNPQCSWLSTSETGSQGSHIGFRVTV